MAKWKVELRGDALDLSALPGLLRAPTRAVTQEGDQYLLTSTEWDLLQEAEKVYDLALQWLPVITGAIVVYQGRLDTPLGIGHVVHISDDGSEKHFVFVSDSGRGRDAVVLKSNSGLLAHGAVLNPDGTIVPQGATIVDSWLAVADREDLVAKALRLFSREHTWDNLYRVYEVVEEDVMVKEGMNSKDTQAPNKVMAKMESYGWAKAADIDRFRGTANSVQWLGDDARHGHEPRKAPPPTPMTHAEAGALVRTIVSQWLRSKS